MAEDTVGFLAASSSLEVAPLLLGSVLISEVGGERVRLVITETEAYGGADDPASHAYRGPTIRNASMFLGGGHLYVYRSYGIHWCANVVTGPPGDGQAVLLRGGTIIEGTSIAERRRQRATSLSDGPGKLAQALGVTGDHDGHPLDRPPLRLLLTEDDPTWRATGRIGLTKAADRRWRFVAVDRRPS